MCLPWATYDGRPYDAGCENREQSFRPHNVFRLGSVFRKLVDKFVDFFMDAVGPTLDEGNGRNPAQIIGPRILLFAGPGKGAWLILVVPHPAFAGILAPTP